MAKLVGVRERLHKPFYDTLIRAEADSATSPNITAETRLFNGTSLGQEAWTNMQVAGQFSSDSTYILLAMRCYMQFWGGTGTSGSSSPKPSELYALTAQQLYLTLITGEKPMITAPAWMFPQGGGIWGYDSVTPISANGVPQTDAILKLAKPVPIPARQSFNVKASFYVLGATNAVTYLNAITHNAHREIKVVIDGLLTRDVQ